MYTALLNDSRILPAPWPEVGAVTVEDGLILPAPAVRRQADPLPGMLQSLGWSRSEARAWASEVAEGTTEDRIAEVLRRHGDLLTLRRKVKAGMPSTATLTALVRRGCEKTAEDVAEEQGIDRGAIEDELGHIRAYAEGAIDLGTGSLIMDQDRGEVTHRIGSGLPTWLQDLGGPKAIVEALERRAGKLYDDLVMLAIENVKEPIPF